VTALGDELDDPDEPEDDDEDPLPDDCELEADELEPDDEGDFVVLFVDVPPAADCVT
jgi:hypothetical protein